MLHDQEKSPPLTPTSERPRSFFARNSTSQHDGLTPEIIEPKEESRPTKWSMGVLNDPHTHEVPGSVLLLTGNRNEPLGLRNAPARTSHGSLPSAPSSAGRRQQTPGKKTTKDGAIFLDPQPDDSLNDPLNWPNWRRDAALLSLGLYCMVGGGMTPILAAGFTNVAATYHVTTPQVALTTGLYMMGMGLGSVFASPTAILFGKRPVYLVSAIVFILTSVWCAASPSYNSLVVARILQGFSVSPVECLPSATIAEIFFLHERAYRLGIYTLLLLGGKNLVPLVSAAIIQSYGWRWVFWIVAMVVGLCGGLLFLFVPETFWDRSPVPKSRRASKSGGLFSRFFSTEKSSLASPTAHLPYQAGDALDDSKSENGVFTSHDGGITVQNSSMAIRRHSTRGLHVGFVSEDNEKAEKNIEAKTNGAADPTRTPEGLDSALIAPSASEAHNPTFSEQFSSSEPQVEQAGTVPMPEIRNFNSPSYQDIEKRTNDYFTGNNGKLEGENNGVVSNAKHSATGQYTATLRDRPKVTFVHQLKPYNGRMHYDNWFKVALRPFILYCYPAVLWSAVVYSCSVGWLIVLSESVAVTYRSKDTYGFSALSTGLIYISPFIGGVLGTAVAGKFSDIIVRAMSKRNGGLYEPEFRLVMAIPISITTVIGLMGFGWSAEVHDAWIVPTIFFGIISFGCSLGSTTAITFCVDSYRQYAGEALVTLNFSKNIFHGLVFSLFFNRWLEADGSKIVFIWLGVIQLILMAFSIPMYIFGKRARMWTVRKNLMEKF